MIVEDSAPPDSPTVIKPGQLYLIKRNGTLVAYDDSKIRVAITKAFLAVEGEQAQASNRIHDVVARLTQEVTHTFCQALPVGGTIHIEDVQDRVTEILMLAGEDKVATAYVLYREKRRQARALQRRQMGQSEQGTRLSMILEDGRRVPLNSEELMPIVQEACIGLNDVNASVVVEEALRNLFDGAGWREVGQALVMASRSLIEREPSYTYLSARLLLDGLKREALSFLNMASHASQKEMQALYPVYFKRYIERGVSLEILDERLLTFDLDKLGQALSAERDYQFTYLGLQTLYDRYLIHAEDTRYELPQAMFMRVAMGLAIYEKDKETWALAFYDLLSRFDYMSSTPTLFNSGTRRPQLSSCYLSTVTDDLWHIFESIQINALLSKYAGGLGNDWTPVRALGAYIKGTNGKSQGVVPFIKVANDTSIAVNQGGKRKGALCVYLETWHLDIEEFLELRKNTGDERRRTHDINTANWIPDLFMERVMTDQEWTLFSPEDVPLLHETYGEVFREHYLAYEDMAKKGKIKRTKRLSAVQLWRKILGLLFETGHPWLTFKDACNLRSPQQHVGVIHSSNLCTEITLNTSVEEVAVCNLGSINLPAHMNENGLNLEKLKKTLRVAMRMLDNVIDVNYYPVSQAEYSNKRHRPVGLGMMGFQDALYQLGIPYASDAAVVFADSSMEQISYYAILASTDLAEERGCYETYQGSLWSQGILPIDSIALLKKARGLYLEQNTDLTLDWEPVRARVRAVGMRNSNIMAIAPTATISNICGVTQSIEPTYQNLFVKSNLSGEFTVVNPYLVTALKARGLWDEVMVNDLKYFDGSVQPIDRIPEEIKQLFATAFEIDPRWLVEAASRRQKWLDQAQSLNIYMAHPSGKKLDALYRLAWMLGLKTTYYLRSLGASSPEKSTIHDGRLNAVKLSAPTVKSSSCNVDDESCESCQ